ncbi:TraB/GumN family protein [Methylophilus aquaticus]|uniref:TraB/GumN family protein n=1 Tax=Methylophilus aquaticus TaxID=1971610 RepID=A0ABT9JUL5_9PROT|nr:TraB/GumN family protein [Methylophilus aquaticus]MDP8568291.1 TraB/GumN family protein [Methylophilus aquaticus]
MRVTLLFIFGLFLWVSGVQAADKSLFWQVESPEGMVSYLFGTMHTDDNRVTDFSPQVIQALQNSDTFMMEVTENRDPGLFMLPNGNLAQYLTNQEFEKVRDLADFHVMHLGAAMQMKPWLLAVVFDLPKPQTPFAQDYLLKTKAEEMDKEVAGLEAPQEHFGVMDSFSIDDQLVMLRAVLKRSQTQKETDFEKLMAAYLSGDADKVAGMDDKITGGMLPGNLWQRMRVKLLDERNLVMAERSIAKAREGKVFVAVGAAHLAGKHGLIDAFRQAGFKMTPLKR